MHYFYKAALVLSTLIDRAKASAKPRIRVVNYGRTIEVGQFGRGRSGRVWFGWEAEVGADETEEDARARLRAMADAMEVEERRMFAERTRKHEGKA